MKRKILSIALVLGMMLSVLSITPVGASDITIANELPYFFNDFEDGVSIFSQANTSIVDGGMGGGKALQVVADFSTSGGKYCERAIQNFSGIIPAGATFKMSFYAKAVTEGLSKMEFHLISYIEGLGDFASTVVNKVSTTEWYKVTINYKPAEDRNFNEMRLREYFEGTYLIDDFEIVLYEKGLIKSDKFASLSDYSVGFENGSGAIRLLINNVGYPKVSEKVTTNGNETFQIVPNPSGTGKVMKLDLSDVQSGDGSIQLTSSDSGDSSPALSGTVPAGGTITYTFKYYFPQEMATDNKPAFCMYHSTGRVFAEGSDFAASANEWHTATLTWTNSTDSSVDLSIGTFRMCSPNNPGRTFKVATLAPGETKYGARTIYFDDFTAKITTPGVEEKPEEFDVQAPVTSELKMLGEIATGKTVTFEHNFAAQDSTSTDKSIVKLLNTVGNLTRTVAYAAIDGEMVIPGLPENGTLSFCVIPIDSAGLVGQPVLYTYVEVVGFVASMELSDFYEDGSVIAKVDMENMKHNKEGVNAILVVLMYDENGALVKYKDKAIICPYNTEISSETEVGQLKVESDTSDPATSRVAKAEAYLWDCGTESLPTFKNTTMQELIADITVEK